MSADRALPMASEMNWPNIIQEARERRSEAMRSTAKAITSEMLTLEYWTAWCAHENASAVPTNAMATRSELVRAMCHIAPESCECADKGQYQDYSACRIVYRHADAILARLTSGEPTNAMAQIGRKAIEAGNPSLDLWHLLTVEERELFNASKR